MKKITLYKDDYSDQSWDYMCNELGVEVGADEVSLRVEERNIIYKYCGENKCLLSEEELENL